jgi:hypothetical protein
MNEPHAQKGTKTIPPPGRISKGRGLRVSPDSPSLVGILLVGKSPVLQGVQSVVFLKFLREWSAMVPEAFKVIVVSA